MLEACYEKSAPKELFLEAERRRRRRRERSNPQQQVSLPTFHQCLRHTMAVAGEVVAVLEGACHVLFFLFIVLLSSSFSETVAEEMPIYSEERLPSSSSFPPGAYRHIHIT